MAPAAIGSITTKANIPNSVGRGAASFGWEQQTVKDGSRQCTRLHSSQFALALDFAGGQAVPWLGIDILRAIVGTWLHSVPKQTIVPSLPIASFARMSCSLTTLTARQVNHGFEEERLHCLAVCLRLATTLHKRHTEESTGPFADHQFLEATTWRR